MNTGKVEYSPDYTSKSRYTDAELMRSLVQVPARMEINPAVAAEHKQLEHRVLVCARKWFAADIAERAFSTDAELRAVIYDLLLFEGRHGFALSFEAEQEKK